MTEPGGADFTPGAYGWAPGMAEQRDECRRCKPWDLRSGDMGGFSYRMDVCEL